MPKKFISNFSDIPGYETTAKEGHEPFLGLVTLPGFNTTVLS